MQRGFAHLIILISIVIIALIAGGIYYLGTRKNQTVQQPIQQATPSPPAETDPTANWKTYTNSTYMLSFKYPVDLLPEEDTSNDTYLLNVLFNNLKEILYPQRKVFQVEIRNQNTLEDEVSYRLWQLSHRVIDDIKETKITTNGLEGSRLDYKFSSEDQVYSKTILIVKGRYMYTIEGETSLIDQILSTFKFLDVVDETSD